MSFNKHLHKKRRTFCHSDVKYLKFFVGVEYLFVDNLLKNKERIIRVKQKFSMFFINSCSSGHQTRAMDCPIFPGVDSC